MSNALEIVGIILVVCGIIYTFLRGLGKLPVADIDEFESKILKIKGGPGLILIALGIILFLASTYTTSISPLQTLTPTPIPTTSTQTPTPAPIIQVSPDPLFFNFGIVHAGEIVSRSFSISNSGGGTLNWNIQSSQSWITVSPTSGANSGAVVIEINSAELNSGLNSGTITITSNGGTKTGTISLMVPPPPTTVSPTTPSPTTPSGFRVVEAILRADPSDYVGSCPVTITFSGRISVAGGSGVVSYKFLRSDGASAPIQTLTFNSPGSMDVSDTWTLGGSALPTYSGWEAIQIFDPQDFESNQSSFKIQCQQGISTPTQFSPSDGSVFSNYPRTTTLTWSPVSGAASYTVEIQYYDTAWESYLLVNVTATSYTFDFVGAQPGRWRVWAIDANGSASPKSGWWGFSYTV